MLEAKLETKYTQNLSNPYLHGRLSFSTNKRLKLNKKWYKYFSMERSFGDLRMNYDTKGKNLGHIFIDNDLKHLIEGGRPVPQSTFNVGINAFFGGYSQNKLSENNKILDHITTIKKIKKWIINNNLQEKYNIKYKESECPGYILLGKFKPTGELDINSKISDVFHYYSEYKYFDSYYIQEIRNI